MNEVLHLWERREATHAAGEMLKWGVVFKVAEVDVV